MIISKMLKVEGNSEINLITLNERVVDTCNELIKSGHKIVSINIVDNKAIIFADNQQVQTSMFDRFKERVVVTLEKWKNDKKINVTNCDYEAMLESIRNAVELELIIYKDKRQFDKRCISCTGYDPSCLRCLDKESEFYFKLLESPYNSTCKEYKSICCQGSHTCSKLTNVGGVQSCSIKPGSPKPCRR